MLSESTMMIVTPVLAFVFAAALAYGLGRIKTRLGLWALAVLWLVFTGVMSIGAATINGWDGVFYMLGLILVSVPAALGALLGGSFGWQRKEKTSHV
ncbi:MULTISPECIES: hypothetical protein [unclassified Yoonia]|uniref:hypothetical protein n=1 Tax=unclassified Yoonia TaxID=2629118 RepID=UPI002AFEBFFC|nr:MULTISPECIES: hypothetical protein [unclassified Yoonia]